MSAILFTIMLLNILIALSSSVDENSFNSNLSEINIPFLDLDDHKSVYETAINFNPNSDVLIEIPTFKHTNQFPTDEATTYFPPHDATTFNSSR